MYQLFRVKERRLVLYTNTDRLVARSNLQKTCLILALVVARSSQVPPEGSVGYGGDLLDFVIAQNNLQLSRSVVTLNR